MDKHQKNKSDLSTLNKNLGGKELREEERIWKEIASCEARLTLMKTMINEDLAFADLEEFGNEFDNKLKSSKMKNRSVKDKITNHAMKIKLADEQTVRRDLIKVKNKMRRDLINKFGGDNTRGYKRAVAHLSKVAKSEKSTLQEKYKNKIKHIKQKCRKAE